VGLCASPKDPERYRSLRMQGLIVRRSFQLQPDEKGPRPIEGRAAI